MKWKVTGKLAPDLIARAEVFNADLDKMDHQSGFANPMQAGPLGLLRTAMSAIECGMNTEDWDTVAQGMVMLMQFYDELTRRAAAKGVTA